jgi:hypothetical protein
MYIGRLIERPSDRWLLSQRRPVQVVIRREISA